VHGYQPDLSREAYKLTSIIHDQPGRGPSDPLFVSFMDT
jgi:hypothetical protein